MHSIKGEEANRCFAVLVFATLLWATEVCWLFFPILPLSFSPLYRTDAGKLIGNTTVCDFDHDSCVTGLVAGGPGPGRRHRCVPELS